MKIRVLREQGFIVEDLVTEFNEQMEELGVSPDDIISVQKCAPDMPMKVHNPKGPAKDATVELVVFCWDRG